MKAVGIRELKAKLSQYIDEVRRGEIVLVTDRGRVVAEIREPMTASTADPFERALAPLVRSGEVRLGEAEGDEDVYVPTGLRVPHEVVARLLDESRAEPGT